MTTGEMGLNERFIKIGDALYRHRDVNSEVDRYVTHQFREDSAKYVASYHDIAEWKTILTRAFSQAGVTDFEKAYRIFDIGSGSGNTVLAALELLPNSFVLATDISLEMLSFLQRFIMQKPEFANRCILAQVNCESPDLEDVTFDMVIGGAVLHHLIDPQKTILACAPLLKPGGVFIASEPFENGFGMLSAAYQCLLLGGESDPDARDVLQRMVTDWNARKGSDKAPTTQYLDDKWLFTQKWFERFVPPYSKCSFQRSLPLVSPFTHYTLEHFEMLGIPRERLSNGAWHFLQTFDEAMSEDLKDELYFLGTILLEK